MADGTIHIDTKLNADGLKSGLAGLGKGIGVALGAIGTGLAAAGKEVVSTGMAFEKTISGIAAVSGATAAEMEALEALAIKAGADTAYSASEAALAIEELIKAGLSVEQVLGDGLAGALDLAAAGELALADAAEIASTALNAFKDDGLSVAQAANILAGAANASATDVQEMRHALSQASAVASMVGLSFEDTATTLAVFAQNGLKGSDAGTSLKTMLMRLQPSTDKQIDMFDELGLLTLNTAQAFNYLSTQGFAPATKSAEDVEKALQALAKAELGSGASAKAIEKRMNELRTESGLLQSAFYDMNGEIKSMEEVAGLLQGALGDLTPMQRQHALEVMFGADAVRGASILFKEGAEGLRAMNDEMGKVSAADVAAERLNNLAGDMEYLSGSVETLGLMLYKVFVGDLRFAAQTATKYIDEIVDAFASLGDDDTVENRLDRTLIKAGEMLGDLLVTITALTPKLVDAAAKVLVAVTGAIRKSAPQVAKAIANIGVTFVKGFAGVLPDIVATGTEIILGLIDGFTGALPELIPLAADMMVSLATGLIDAIPRLIDAIPKIVSGLIQGFQNTDWAGLWSQLVESFEGVGTSLQGAWDTLTEYMKGVDWAGVWENVKQTATAAWDYIKDAFGTVVDAIRAIDWSGIWAGIQTAFADAASMIKKLITGDENASWPEVGQAILRGINTALSGAAAVVKKLITGDANASWSEVGAKVLAGIKAGLAGVGSIIKNLITGDPGASWLDVGKTLLEGIKAGLAGIGAAITSVIGTDLSSAGDSISKFGGAAGVIAADIVSALLAVDWVGMLAPVGGAIMLGLSGVVAGFLGEMDEKASKERHIGWIERSLMPKEEDFDSALDYANHKTREMFKDFLATSDREAARTGEAMAVVGYRTGQELMDSIDSAFESGDFSSVSWAMDSWAEIVRRGYSDVVMTQSDAHEKIKILSEETSGSLYTALTDPGADVQTRAVAAALMITTGFGETFVSTLSGYDEQVALEMEGLLANGGENLLLTAEQYGIDIGSLLGVSIPEGFSLGIENGQLVLTDQLGNLVDIATLAGQQMEIATKANDTGALVPESVGEGAQSNASEVEAGAQAVADGVTDTIEDADMPGALAETGGEASGGLATGLEDGTEAVTGAATGLHDGVVEPLAVLPDEVLALIGEAVQNFLTTMSAENGTTIGTSFSQAITSAVNTNAAALQSACLSAGRQAADAAREMLSAANGTTIGQNFLQAVTAAITALAGALESAARSAGQTAVTASRDTLSSETGRNIGVAFGQGIASGISSMSGAIADAARSAAAAALAAAKAELGIASPSKETYKFGQYFDEGFADGIQRNKTLAVEEARALAEAASKSLSGENKVSLAFDAHDLVRKAQAALDQELLHMAVAFDVLASAGATSGDSAGGGTVVIEELNVYANSPADDLNIDELAEQVSEAIAEGARRQKRWKGGVR